MDKLKQIFGGDTRQFGMIFALVALIVFFQICTEGLTLKPENVINIFQGNSYILVMAIGMVLVIIAGHIDLSVGSVAAFVGITVAIAMRDWGIPWWVGILLGLARRRRDRRLAGLLGGRTSASRPSSSRSPACSSSAAPTSSSASPTPSRSARTSRRIGAGYLPEVGPNTGYNNLTVLLGLLLCAGDRASATLRNRRNQRKIGAELETARCGYIRLALICVAILAAVAAHGLRPPRARRCRSPALILGVLVLVYGFIATRTIVGRHVYAVGGNRHAAELSGVRSQAGQLPRHDEHVDPRRRSAGMMFVARSTASGPFDGVGWELDAIAAVFIGGAAVTGGVGTVVGSIIGGLVMAVLNNGLQLKGSAPTRPRSSRAWCCSSPSPSTSTTRARGAGRSPACS